MCLKKSCKGSSFKTNSAGQALKRKRRKRPKLEMGGTGSKTIGKGACKIQGGMKTGLKESFCSTGKKEVWNGNLI